MKTCFRCNKKIEETSNYYAFIEYNNKKKVSTVYAHRTCWDDFLNSLSALSNAQDMLKGLQQKLREVGVLSPQEVVI